MENVLSFLERAYGKYRYNCAHENPGRNNWHKLAILVNPFSNGIYSLASLKPNNFLSGAFVWIGTPEGGDFWSDINNEWIDYFQENSTQLL